MVFEKGIFQRTELLLGKEMMSEIARKRVIIFGIGGVGSWCAESLIRSGIRHLTIVDSDLICVTNINRQLQATTLTVGKVKTEILKERLMEINPMAEVNAVQKIYCPENSDFFSLEQFDFIIDAIDSIGSKVDLIRKATRCNAVFLSSMGASLKIDPTKIRVDEFWNVKGCPLGSRIRKNIKKGDLPAKKFFCVYSEELLENKGTGTSCGTSACLCPKLKTAPGDPCLADHEWCSKKAVINGTIAHITAIFGFTLAGLVMHEIYKNINKGNSELRTSSTNRTVEPLKRSGNSKSELY
jgi:tRNA threonylcarbamoyladenosine dehydratase